MTALNVQGIDLSKLEKVLELEDVNIKCCKCFPSSKCCIKINLSLEIKQRAMSFMKQISAAKDIEKLKD